MRLTRFPDPMAKVALDLAGGIYLGRPQELPTEMSLGITPRRRATRMHYGSLNEFGLLLL